MNTRARVLATVATPAIVVLSACHDVASVRERVSPAFAVADSLRIEGRAAAAAPHYRALSDSFSAAHDTASWWRAQLWLAQTLLSKGQRDSGLASLALATRLAGPRPDRLGWTLYVRSIFQDRVGHFDSAFVTADSARRLALRSTDHELEAAAWHAIGRIHSLSGRYHEALAANLQSLDLDNQFRAAPRQVALELNELGIDYRHLGRLTDAVAAYDSALRVERLLKSPEGIARVEYNLANVRQAAGDDAGALALLTDALTRAEQIGEVRGTAFIHGGLADLYLRARAFDSAREHYVHALAINRSAQLPYGEVQNLEGIGRIELAQGRAALASHTLRSALVIADSAHYGKERATVRAALARAMAVTGDSRAARRWADEAMHIADSLDDPAVELEARGARAVALEAARDPAASGAYLSAIDLLESWRGRLALGDLRMGVTEPHLDVFEGAIRTLLAAHRSDEAFLVAERARARLLLDVMAEHDVRNLPRSEEGRIRLALREAFEARVEASPGGVQAADRTIDSLTRVLDSREGSARTHDAAWNVRDPAPASAADVRDRLLRTADRTLLLYFWGERDVYGWGITRDGVRARRLGAAAELAPQLEFLRATLSGGADTPWRPAAHLAYQRFVEPLVTTATSEILVVPSGPLSFVPIEAFIARRGGDPLGATRRISYGPSASVLLALERTRPAAPGTRTLLAIGDPLASPSTARTGDERARTPGSQLADLPAAAMEARTIVQLMGGDALTGGAATLVRWRALDPGRYRYLHFATHARLDDDHPQRSALLLADGPLDLEQIRRLRLSADLVTLSACETGLGPQLGGEGVIGLPHAFLEAGAHAVIVSLWRVRDRAAEQYMVDFYRELRRGLSPDDAMLAVRQARLRSTGNGTPSPAEWAAFVLIGGRREALRPGARPASPAT